MIVSSQLLMVSSKEIYGLINLVILFSEFLHFKGYVAIQLKILINFNFELSTLINL